ncbi:MAG: Gfo/Idh/MocA family oxidoreductase [Acetobacteraceae bacterium]|nr:Gfo/Idh/MocA family oxidoreductase [Acetobacteraceae bacterium]
MILPKRFAVIDVSHWHSTHDASYCRILRDLGREIVGVSDRNATIAEDRARRFGGLPFTDYLRMIEATKPEFVIALGRHADMPDTFRALVETGLPFIMEKPWGTDPDTVASLVALATERGTWVAVPFVNRTSHWALTARRMVEDGVFGTISHISYRTIRPTMRRYIEWDSPWMADPAAAGGGALMNLGGHGFDMAWFLTREEPEVVSAVLSHAVHGAPVEDYALVTLRTPDGILFHNEVGYTMPTWPANQTDGEQKVAGSRLLLRATPQGLHVLGSQRDEMISAPAGEQGGYPKWVRETLEAFARGDPPPAGADACGRVARLTHAAYRMASSAPGPRA